MGPNREITEDTWSGEGTSEIVFEEEPSDNILMDIQFRCVVFNGIQLKCVVVNGIQFRCVVFNDI